MKIRRLSLARLLLLTGPIPALGLVLVWAGNLEPPAPPASTMTSLDVINSKLEAIMEANSLSSVHRFVGVTAATTSGGAGWKAMNELCQAEFGSSFPGVRMCKSGEVMHTPVSSWPPLPGNAWLHPTFVPGIAQPSAVAYDVTGNQRDPTNLTCQSWHASVSTAFGMVLEQNGAFFTHFCDEINHVACCAK